MCGYEKDVCVCVCIANVTWSGIRVTAWRDPRGGLRICVITSRRMWSRWAFAVDCFAEDYATISCTLRVASIVRYTSRPTHPGLLVDESTGYPDRHDRDDYERRNVHVPLLTNRLSLMVLQKESDNSHETKHLYISRCDAVKFRFIADHAMCSF